MVASLSSSQSLSSSPSMDSPPEITVPTNHSLNPSIDTSSKDEVAEVSSPVTLPRPDLPSGMSSTSVLDPNFSWVAPPELILNCAMESLMPSPGRFMESTSESPRFSLSEQFFNGELNNSELPNRSSKTPICVNKQLEMVKPVEGTVAADQELAVNGSVVVASSTIQSLPLKPPQGAWASPFKIAALFPAMEKTAPSFLRDREDAQTITSANEQWPSLASSTAMKQPLRKRTSQVSMKPSLYAGATIEDVNPLAQDIIKASEEYPWAAKMKSVCNLHRVTNPVYMEDGTPKVSIPSHVLLEGIENQNQFIVGQFYRCKAPSGGLIHAIASRIWGKKCRIFTRKLGESSYLFHIPDEATRKWVIQRGIWHVDDCLMFVSPWSPSPVITLPEISTIPVWCTLQNIPYQLYSIKGIDWIASGIGEPMLTSKPCLDPTQMGEAKILVEVKLNKPFPQRVALEDKSGSITMVNVLYSWLPPKCGCCGQLGHKASHCLGTFSAFSGLVAGDGSGAASAFPQPGHVEYVVANTPESAYVNGAASAHVALAPAQVLLPVVATVPETVISPSHSPTLAFGISETCPNPKSFCTSHSAISGQAIPNARSTTAEASAPTISTISPVTINCSSMLEAVIQPATMFSEIATCSKDALVIKENETSDVRSTPASDPSFIVNQQGNNLPYNSLDLDATLHILGETLIRMRKDNKEDSMGAMVNPFAVLNQNDSFIENSNSQLSRGGRHIKPSQKAQEMLWIKAGGRGKRGRGRG